MIRVSSYGGWSDARLLMLAAVPALMGLSGGALAGSPPAIRISASSPDTHVPGCVTPQRLMEFLGTRHPNLDARYANLAQLYKRHGEEWRVRWDYAFYQMVVETNYLLFRRGDGHSGDVNPKQYNFAGLGTTGGGVPGDAYPDANTGVLAQIQHLVAYSGERVDRPIGARTKLAQDDIISASASVSRKRAVTFQDLAGRWASDRSYWRSIESVAERYRAMFCTGREASVVPAQETLPPPPAPKLVARPQQTQVPAARVVEPAVDAKPAQVRVASVRAAVVTAPGTAAQGSESRGTAGLVAPEPVVVANSGRNSGCKVQTASYGGRKSILIRAVVDGAPQLTALQVLDGFEASMTESFTRSHAPGGKAVGEFPSQEAALQHAQRICLSEADNATRRR